MSPLDDLRGWSEFGFRKDGMVIDQNYQSPNNGKHVECSSILDFDSRYSRYKLFWPCAPEVGRRIRVTWHTGQFLKLSLGSCPIVFTWIFMSIHGIIIRVVETVQLVGCVGCYGSCTGNVFGSTEMVNWDGQLKFIFTRKWCCVEIDLIGFLWDFDFWQTNVQRHV